MAALINPMVCSLFRFKTSPLKPDASTTILGQHSTTTCDAETSDNYQRYQETPVETGFTGFSTLLKPLPTWRRSVFRWFVGPVYAASSASDGDPNVKGAPNEPAPDVADRTCFDKGLSWICWLFAQICAPSRRVEKRSDYLEWEEYYMAVAALSAKRSKDPVTQVGACIVNKDKKIVGIGYNGMPIGCSDDDLPWGKGSKRDMANKHLFVCHAELNAIVNKIEADVRGCTMYVGLFPCNECAKLIVQSGIKEVVYYSDPDWGKPEYRASKMLLNRAQVKYRKYLPEKPKVSEVLVDFKDPSKNAAEPKH